MDEIAKYNQARWKALVEADALFTRPNLNLDFDSARQVVDSVGKLGEVAGRDVLCLAGGGGRQSAARFEKKSTKIFAVTAWKLQNFTLKI